MKRWKNFILAIKKEKKSADDVAYNTIVFWTDNLQFYNKTGKQMGTPRFILTLLLTRLKRRMCSFLPGSFLTRRNVSI